ncbi:MAG: hypothetical protein N2645_13975 [Clostridia bacterium]|nr:hypothetical protein [Clostridia bacterium]
MNFAFIKKEKQPKEVVVLSDAVYHSYLGEYFLVHHQILQFINCKYNFHF